MPIIILGIIFSFGTALWWNAEVVGRIGESINFSDTSVCLAKIGSGDCQALWFVGLHQENIIAGLVFWLGLIAIVAGIFYELSRPGYIGKDESK